MFGVCTRMKHTFRGGGSADLGGSSGLRDEGGEVATGVAEAVCRDGGHVIDREVPDHVTCSQTKSRRSGTKAPTRSVKLLESLEDAGRVLRCHRRLYAGAFSVTSTSTLHATKHTDSHIDTGVDGEHHCALCATLEAGSIPCHHHTGLPAPQRPRCPLAALVNCLAANMNYSSHSMQIVATGGMRFETIQQAS